MRLITMVWQALRTFDRPATRVEIESETGLDRDGVRKGLEGLERRGDLVIDGEPRKLTSYQLKPGTKRPEDLRGKHRAARPPAMLVPGYRPKVAKVTKVIIGKARLRAHGVPDESAAALLRRLMNEEG